MSTEAHVHGLPRDQQVQLFKQFLTAFHLSRNNVQVAHYNHRRLAVMKDALDFTDEEVALWMLNREQTSKSGSSFLR